MVLACDCLTEWGREVGIEELENQIVAWYAAGARDYADFGKLGVEVEHFVVTDDGRPVSFEPTDGHVGIHDLMHHLALLYPERTYNDRGELVGLLGPGGSVTLEPASQVEISLAVHETVAGVREGYEEFRAAMDPFLGQNGMRVANGGYHPTRKASELRLIPKSRYEIMNRYFAFIGSHGERMMRATASTQVSVDFRDEADAVRKLRLASALAPMLAAIADCTTTFEGEPNVVPIRRLSVWRDVDDLRCRVIPGVFAEGFGFRALARWLLGTPPIFVERAARDGAKGAELQEFFEVPASRAYEGAQFGPGEVAHLVSMFWPDVRLKQFVEIRPADSLPEPQVLGYTALVKALFYGEGAMRRVEDALGVRGDTWPIGAEDVEDAIAAIARRGFAGEAYGLSLAEWEDLLFGAAREALPAGERAFLDPLEEFAHDKPFWRVG